MNDLEIDVLDLPALSKEVAADLTKKFGRYFTAQHNARFVYDLPELETLHVDTYTAGLAMERVTREDFSNLPTINIVMQQVARTQDETDQLTRLACMVLRFLLGKTFLDGALFSSDGSFIQTEIFDRLVEYEENVFMSVIEINFKRAN